MFNTSPTLLRTLKLSSVMCTSALVSALAGCAAPAPSPLEGPAAARMAAWQRAPEAAGELVYHGTTYTLSPPGTTALYRYTRRVRATGNGAMATHLTQTPEGELHIAEMAEFGPGYRLHRFEAINTQQGFSGSATLSADGRHLAFKVQASGSERTATENVTAPVVSGPTLHGFVHHHWDALAAGQVLPVRLIALQALQTYGFDIALEGTVAGNTSFSITPSNFFVRLAIAPLRVVFDSVSHQVVRYEGRVPPMHRVDGRWVDLDARVEYQPLTPQYR